MHEISETTVQNLSATDASVVRLLQLTDCHILAGERDCLRGMNTRASFEAVCEAAFSENADLDLLLATGDLAQDSSASAYRYLAGRFNALDLPVFWLPGNHDDAGLMHEQLNGEQIFGAKQVVIGGWVIVLLDSTLAGESSGQLSRHQLDFLDTALRQHAQLHALVCLHHQPLPTGSAWIDQLGLHNAQTFTDTISAQANVRGVLWGHVHQQWHRQIDGIEWMSTPSTCIQFKPGSKGFALDDLAPGYRRLDLLADGSIVTAVQRVEGFDAHNK
jgi:Icc protein